MSITTAPNESGVVILITSIYDTSGLPKIDKWNDVPFVCDVCDKKVVELEKCPLCADTDLDKFACNASCLHFCKS